MTVINRTVPTHANEYIQSADELQKTRFVPAEVGIAFCWLQVVLLFPLEASFMTFDALESCLNFTCFS